MNDLYYQMIFKRKSFHLFKNVGNQKINHQVLSEIEETYSKLTPLDLTIKTKIKIVPASDTNCKRGQEYCILFYSEKKGNYLQNIGYLGEQLDLYLVSKNIGTLWYGIGKTTESNFNGLEFIIMIAISQIDDSNKFRKNMFKAKRKEINEFWSGEQINNFTDIVRFAPSACNTQPWFVEHTDNTLKIYRYKKDGKRGIMPINKVSFYNRIDIGIFLCFIDLCFAHCKVNTDKEIKTDFYSENEMTLEAIYHINYVSENASLV